MKNSLLSALALLLALMMGACSKSTDMLQYASADDVMIALLDLSKVYDNAGCKVSDDGASPSEAIISLGNKTNTDLSKLLFIKGVDLKRVVLSKPDVRTTVAAARITNKSALTAYLTEIGFEEENGSYASGDSKIFVDGDIATLVIARNADQSTLAQLHENAADSPITDVQRSHLSDGNAASLLFNVKKLYSLLPAEYAANFIKYPEEVINQATAVIAVSISGTKANASLAFYDADNQRIKNEQPTADVNTSLLKYASATDMAAVMASVPEDYDWASVFDKTKRTNPYGAGLDPAVADVIVSILENVDGTAMLAGGPISLMGVNELSGWNAVAAVEFKGDMAGEYFNQIRDLATQSMANLATVSTSSDTKFTISIPSLGSFYVQQDGKVLIISLSPIAADGKSNFKASDFKGHTGACVIDIPKDNIFSTFIRFPFGIKSVYTANDNEIDLSIEETDTDGLFLENIISFASTL